MAVIFHWPRVLNLMMVKKTFLLPLFFLSFLALSENPKINIKLSNTELKSSWNFLPEMPDAFQNYQNKEAYIDFKIKKYKFIFQKNNFAGQGARETYPKEINSQIDIDGLGFSYDFNDKTNLFYLYEESLVKPETFSCYQKGSLVIGGCAEADLKITSTLEKYDNLEDNILSISGEAEIHTIGILLKDLLPYFDEANISYAVQKHDFDWLTPVEEIRSPVILNAEINGQTVGDLIAELLSDLPQREPWKTHVVAFKLSKNHSLKHFNFFYELTSKKGNRVNFTKFKDSNKFNHNLAVGVSKELGKLHIKFVGNIYTNFLSWHRDELYNKRSSNYFDEKFGDLKLELLYSF